MKNKKIFLLLSLFFLYKSEEYIEETLAEEIKTYHRNENEFLYIKYVAKDDGKYLIIFPKSAYIIKIKGEIHPDIKYRENQEYDSRIYIQDFKKGDYVKIK